MIDRSMLGMKSEPLTVPVEAGQLKFFAKATGEKNPIYTDEAAAKAAGYSALPAPPTFCFSLSLAHPDPFKTYRDLGLDLAKILHAEQQFEYFAPIVAGDVVTIEQTLVDAFEKKGGALAFYVFEGVATNQNGDVAVKMKLTLMHRNG